MWDSCPGWGRLLEADKNYHLLSQIVMTEGLGSDLVTKAKKSVSRFPKKSYVCVTVLELIRYEHGAPASGWQRAAVDLG